MSELIMCERKVGCDEDEGKKWWQNETIFLSNL
jgi:hypothetical protein